MARSIIRNRDIYKGRDIYQEDNIILNVHGPNNIASIYLRKIDRTKWKLTFAL